MIHQLDAPAIGYRAFSWNGGALLGIGFGAEWPVQKGPQVANCAHCEGAPSSAAMGTRSFWPQPEKREWHDAPLESCSCGVYALNDPKRVSGGVIKAVTIGYGKLVVHPDGWRAEKSELIGLIAPPPKPNPACDHRRWNVQSDYCETCGCTRQLLEQTPPSIVEKIIKEELQAGYKRAAQCYPNPGVSPTMKFSGLLRNAWPDTPSLDALEILAEQYGARVIQNWDDGVALAEEQGAKPIPDEVYAEAAANALVGEGSEFGGYIVAPLPPSTTSIRFSQELPEFHASRAMTPYSISPSPATAIELSGYEISNEPGSTIEYMGVKYVVTSVERNINGEVTINARSIGPYEEININITKVPLTKKPSSKRQSSSPQKKSAIDEKLKLMREKRELHAKHWKPDAKAA